jgi:hypothetical protein
VAEATSDDAPDRSGYTLRVPVRTLGENPIVGLDNPCTVQVEDLKVTIRADPPLLVISVDGFSTERAARDFIPRIIVGLWALVVRWNIAFRADFSPQPVTYAKDPVAAGINLAHTFGGEESGPPVDAIAGRQDTVIYPSNKRLRWFGIGDMKGTVQTPASLAMPVFVQGISNDGAGDLVADERFKTAIELYNEYFYERSIRAKFLTIAMILEVLAPTTEKHAAAQGFIKEWKQQLESAIANTEDDDARLALDSLNRELDFRRERSIRQRVRQLVRDQFTTLPQVDRQKLEKQAVDAYDARGALMHSGQLPEAELNTMHEQAAAIVRRILSQRLRVDV